MNYQQILERVYKEVLPYAKEGKQASYIPMLAEVNPDQFGVCLTTPIGASYKVGDHSVPFSIQSISKVFSFSMAFSVLGDAIWERMSKEPSGSAFNSLVQLEYEHGKPRNPFINAGAIVTADILISNFEDPEKAFMDFVKALCGNDRIRINQEVAVSEQSCGYLNAAIANLMKYHGNIENDITDVLRLYFRMCSLEMSCDDLSRAFLAFADHTLAFDYAGIKLTRSQVKRINAIMQTCGFYDEAGEFSFLVGLPGKSGVGGGIAAICPRRYSVAVWSPRLDSKGNSLLGMKFLELLTTYSEESIF